MVNTWVSVGGHLALIAVLAVNLHGCMLDPAGLAMGVADMAYTSDEPTPMDLTADYKDMYRAQTCEQLSALDSMHRRTPAQPGAQAYELQVLEAFRQLKLEKGCPAVAVAPTPTPIPAAVVAPVPASNTSPVASSNRGWLGASMLEGTHLPATLAHDLGLVDGHGVLVIGVAPGSAAAQAGLKVADVIQSIDGQVYDSADQLIAALAAHKPGDVLALQVWRNHASLPLKTTLTGTQPQFATGAVGVHCYVQTVPSPPLEGGAIFWLTQPFAVPGATFESLGATSQLVGQQFKDYLLSQGVNARSLKASLGICSLSYAQSVNSLQRTLEARKGGEFATLGATSLTVYWQP